MVVRAFNSGTWETGRHISFKFKANLVCIVSFRLTRALSLKTKTSH